MLSCIFFSHYCTSSAVCLCDNTVVRDAGLGPQIPKGSHTLLFCIRHQFQVDHDRLNKQAQEMLRDVKIDVVLLLRLLEQHQSAR
jgi:hypothetical protein